MSGTIIDQDRLVIGADEGLYCVDLDHSGKFLAHHTTKMLSQSFFYNRKIK